MVSIRAMLLLNAKKILMRFLHSLKSTKADRSALALGTFAMVPLSCHVEDPISPALTPSSSIVPIAMTFIPLPAQNTRMSMVSCPDAEFVEHLQRLTNNYRRILWYNFPHPLLPNLYRVPRRPIQMESAEPACGPVRRYQSAARI